MYQSPISKLKVHSLLDCIYLNPQPTEQQKKELFAIANDCVYLEDL